MRLFILVCFVAASACGAETHQTELRQLRRSIETLQSQVAHQDARLEALSNRVVMLADRPAAEPSVPHQPVLDVVKLQPAEYEPSFEEDEAEMAEEDEEPPIVLTLAGATPPKLLVVPVAPAPALSRTEDPGRSLFVDGLKAHGAGNDKLAVQHFSHLVERYPNSKHVASAYYWMGECYFEAGEVRQAIGHYERVYRAYPKDTKAADALLKTGLSHLKIDDAKAAEIAFEAILLRYPRSAQADLAKVHLGKVSTGGR